MRQSARRWVSATVSAFFHQRGHVVPAALWMALRALGSAPNITALRRLSVCCSVSSQGGVPPWLRCTRLTPSASGSAVMPGALPFIGLRFALQEQRTQHHRFSSARSLWLGVSNHGGVPPWPSCTRLSRSHRRFCGACPLRPHASLLLSRPCKIRFSKSTLHGGTKNRFLDNSGTDPIAHTRSPRAPRRIV